MRNSISFLGLYGDLVRYASCTALLPGLSSISLCLFQALSSASLSFLGLILHQPSTTAKKTGIGGPTKGHPYSNLLDRHLHLNPGNDSDWSAQVLDPPLDQSPSPRKWSTLIGQLASAPPFGCGDRWANLDHIEHMGVAIPKSKCWMTERNIIFPLH